MSLDSYLRQYIAKYDPDGRGRHEIQLYKNLVANEQGLWPWAHKFSAQSWRARYVNKAEEFNRHIEKQSQKRSSEFLSQAATPTSQRSSKSHAKSWVAFNEQDESFIVQYLANKTPDGARRKGNSIWKAIEDEAAERKDLNKHSWSSWREHYVKKWADFDERVELYQMNDKTQPISQPQSKPQVYLGDVAQLPMRSSAAVSTSRLEARIPARTTHPSMVLESELWERESQEGEATRELGHGNKRLQATTGSARSAADRDPCKRPRLEKQGIPRGHTPASSQLQRMWVNPEDEDEQDAEAVALDLDCFEDEDGDEDPKVPDMWPPKRGKGKEKATQLAPPHVGSSQVFAPGFFPGRALSEDVGMGTRLQDLHDTLFFSSAVMERTFEGCGTVALTDAVLSRMKKAAIDVAQAFMDEQDTISLRQQQAQQVQDANSDRASSDGSIQAEPPESLWVVTDHSDDNNDNNDDDDDDGCSLSQDHFVVEARKLQEMWRGVHQ